LDVSRHLLISVNALIQVSTFEVSGQWTDG